MQLIDTHCHIHEAGTDLASGNPTRALWERAGNPKPDDIIARATEVGVVGMICVGTTAADSELAVRFVQNRPQCWASVGLHPHEAKNTEVAIPRIADLLSGGSPSYLAGVSQKRRNRLLRKPTTFLGSPPQRRSGEQAGATSKIVAIGECGLDYFYDHSPRKDQITALRFQLELALEHDLPVIFHVREAFDDFWPIFDSYKGLRGVLHSFTDSQTNADKALGYGLFLGLNGIMTFTKNDAQLVVAKNLPLASLLLETDSPYLTPKPHRGTINEPAKTRHIAEFLAELRGEPVEKLATATSQNARQLFNLE